MNHWIVAPVLIPGLVGAFTVLAARFDSLVQRALSVAASLVVLAISIGLFLGAQSGDVGVYLLGNWAAPFGIVLVTDRLSTLMVLLAAVLAITVLLYAIGSGWDHRGRHFHALFQFQIMGIMGAFLTGDLFNLFVFFEILLIASYGLMIHGAGADRLRAGTQYVLYNLLGSTLFLFALGAIYAETGTLNMADLAGRVAAIDASSTAGIRVAAALLLMVFAVKAAIVPLQFWLPMSYSEAPAPVAALFAIMTKVGAYSIIRIYTLVFPPDLEITAGLHGAWLMPAAILGVAIGMVGVLAAKRLDRLVSFAVIGSMGMVMIAVAVFTENGIAAALYYIVNSTLATGALFLLVDMVRTGRGGRDVALEPAPPMARGPVIAGMFFAAAIGMAGLPPLSGFVGKLLILDAALASPLAAWAWAAILLGSLVAVTGFSRAGSTLFWKSREVGQPHTDDVTSEQDDPRHDPEFRGPKAPILPFVAAGGLIAGLAALTLFAGPAMQVMDATAAQLFSPDAYITTVMGTEGKDLSGSY